MQNRSLENAIIWHHLASPTQREVPGVNPQRLHRMNSGVSGNRAIAGARWKRALPSGVTSPEHHSRVVKGLKVTLDSIVRQFKLGETAGQIQHSFPSLSLREIYGAIYYCLENTEAVEEYLRQQEQAEEEGERFIESHFDTTDLRARILARNAHRWHGPLIASAAHSSVGAECL